MQPCAVCGAGTVGHAGRCTGCGTVRGLPAGGPPAGRRTRPFLIPLVTLSITLVVLLAAIAAVLVARAGRGPAGGPTGAAATTATTAATADVDRCVVGRWRVDSHREDVPVAGVGTVTFTGGAGASTVYAADGTGTTSYPPGTAFEGRTGGRTVRLVVAGVVTYGFAARDGTLSFRAVRSRASATVFVDGRRSGSPTPFVAGDDPATYACTGGTLVQRTALYETTLTRAG